MQDEKDGKEGTSDNPEQEEAQSNYVLDADVGSKAWQGRTRARARMLAERIETGYLELGEILYRIYDAPVDGSPNGGPVLTRWGYSNITEYAERELNIHHKKAQRLIRIFYRVEVEMNGFDNPDLKRRFIKLGWSKARELVRVLTKDNAEEWIARAEAMNYTTTVETVKRYLQIEEAKKIKAEVAKQPDPIAQSNQISAEGRFVGDYAEESPFDKKWVGKAFQLEASQAETVNLALKRAQDLAGNIKKSPSTLLSLICLDFLSGADWKGNDLDSKLRFLAKIERSLGGLRVVVVDESNQVVYGLGALQAAANQMKADAAEDDAE